MSKSTRITAIALKAIASLMLVMSSVMKLTHAQAIVEGFSKSNLIHFLSLIGIIELASVVLFWIPKTTRLGFLLLCAYLGGAISIELAGGQFPTAAVFMALIWISVFISNRTIFLSASETANKA